MPLAGARPSMPACLARPYARKPAAGPGPETCVAEEPDPMASYLVQVAAGNLDIVRGTGPHGLPMRSAIDADVPNGAAARTVLGKTGEMISFYEGLFGRYPFVDYGGLVIDRPLGFS